MPTTVNGRIYYRTTESAEMTGVSRSTLLRWFSNGVLKDSAHRDRRGWRLFTEADIKNIKAEANHIR
ncbi:MerR family transcriptional regulator [Chloroflexota bacterium]